VLELGRLHPQESNSHIDSVHAPRLLQARRRPRKCRRLDWCCGGCREYQKSKSVIARYPQSS
jgi:hypothetical protein